jgi:hypothetical protein
MRCPTFHAGTILSNSRNLFVLFAHFSGFVLGFAHRSVGESEADSHNGSGVLRLDRKQVSQVPLEGLFGITHLHAGTHQTMTAILKTMEIDQAIGFVSAHDKAKNRRFSYRETIGRGEEKYVLQSEPVLLARAVSKLAGFPVANQFAFGLGHDEGRCVEYLLSDALSPFATANLGAISNKHRRSLYQELQGVAASSRRILLSSKSTVRNGLDAKASDPIEMHIADLFAKKLILGKELRMLIKEAGQAPADGVEPLPNLRRATKRMMLDWIGRNRADLAGRFTR